MAQKPWERGYITQDQVNAPAQAASAGSMPWERGYVTTESETQAPVVRNAPPTMGQSADAAALQAASLNWDDEANGVVNAFKNGLFGKQSVVDAYRQGRDEVRARNKAAEAANPLTYNATHMAGTLGVQGATAAVAPVAGNALVGALQAWGASEGDVGDQVVDAGIGAVTGGVGRKIASNKLVQEKSLSAARWLFTKLADGTIGTLKTIGKAGVGMGTVYWTDQATGGSISNYMRGILGASGGGK